MSIYEKLLDEIIARLKGNSDRPAFEAAGVKIERSADTTGEHEKLAPQVFKRIRVSCLQDRYGTDENDTAMKVGDATMERVIYYELSVESKKRYGALGGLHICEIAMRMLLGYKSEEFGGELYAFAMSQESYRDETWYYRVIVRWKFSVLKPLDQFRITGDEDLGGVIAEINFTPEQINVLDGSTPGYLQYLTDEQGNKFYVPNGYVIVKAGD